MNYESERLTELKRAKKSPKNSLRLQNITYFNPLTADS